MREIASVVLLWFVGMPTVTAVIAEVLNRMPSVNIDLAVSVEIGLIGGVGGLILKTVHRVEERLGDVETDFHSFKTDVQGMKDDVQGVKTDVQGLKDDVQGVKTDVQDMKDDVQGLKTDVHGLKVDVHALKNEGS